MLELGSGAGRKLGDGLLRLAIGQKSRLLLSQHVVPLHW